MQNNILPRAFGRHFSKLNGLAGLYLHPDLDRAFGEAIVDAINAGDDTDPPRAILVVPDPGDVTFRVEVSVRDATSYRQDDRVAVFSRQDLAIASLDKTYRREMTPSFPDEGSAGPTLDQLARACLDEVVTTAGLPELVLDIDDDMVSCLGAVFSRLRDLHPRLSEGSWPVQWMRHVDIGLALLADSLGRNEGKDVARWLEDNVQSAFSLPTVPAGERPASAVKVAGALRAHWGTSELVSDSLAKLAARDEHDDVHPLSSLDWEEFAPEELDDNVLLALASCDVQASGRNERFAALTEADLLSPVGPDSHDVVMVDAQDNTLSIEGGGDTAFLSSAVNPGSPGELVTQELLVKVPLVGEPASELVDATELGVVTTPRSYRFVVAARQREGHHLVLRGRFSRTASGAVVKHDVRKRRLKVQIDGADPLSPHVSRSAGADFVILPPAQPGVLLMGVNSTDTLSWTEALCPNEYPIWPDAEDFPDHSVHIVKAQSTASIACLLWGAAEGWEPTVAGKPAAPVPGRPGLWKGKLTLGGQDVLDLGNAQFELQLDDGDERPLSPIVAAIQKVRSSTEVLAAPATLFGLQGEAEQYFAERIVEGGDELDLFHAVLPEDLPGTVGGAVPVADGAFVAAQTLAGRWPSLGIPEVPPDLLDSEEAGQFRKSMQALGLDSLLRGRDGTVLWPSRASVAHLHGSGALRAYTEAHSLLLKRARELEDEMALFWAAYPASVSIWRVTEGTAVCRAVLLSPLHPVRLNWLAAAESTLRDAKMAHHLAGTVEGWNFPSSGPGEAFGGKMLALPIDNGPGQVFLGWSMLVAASTSSLLPPRPPEFAGTMRMPGTAASGLNAGGVRAALRDYRRMNPFVSTMSIDLVATAEAPRLAELDTAVVDEVASWAKDDGQDVLPGGARVFDSLQRQGNPPVAALTTLSQTTDGVPVTWSRYRYSAGNSKVVNLRILQDAGVSFALKPEDKGYGFMSEVPLRRFEAPGQFGAKDVTSLPGLAFGDGTQTAFGELLGLLEAGEYKDHSGIRTRITGNLLAEGTADWTVSGEAMVSPAALAALLTASASSSHMLWEWRPPYLDPDSDALERRPYISVVRVPQRFRQQLDKRIALVPELDGTDLGGRVLDVLGGRGVGLSSLLSAGGSQVNGALGFYLALELLGALAEDADGLFVLPIDVCDGFLTSIAGGRAHGTDKRRADLLVFMLKDEKLQLAPIEIKFYDFDTPSTSCPSQGAMQEPIEQLLATSGLLGHIAEEWEIGRGRMDSDHLLRANAVSTLLDSAVRLAPNPPADRAQLASRMARVSAGTAELEITRPIVLYFTRGARTPDGQEFTTWIDPDLGDQGVGALLADPVPAMQRLASAEALPSQLMATLEGLLVPDPTPVNPNTPTEPVSPAPPGHWGPPVGQPVALAKPPGLATSQSPQPLPEEPIEEAPAHQDAGNDGESVVPTMSAVADRPAGPESPEQPSEGVRFSVGRLLRSVGSVDADHWPSNTSLNQLNVGVVGDLGTGKTQLLKAFITKIRAGAEQEQPSTPLSFLIFDYKRDFQDPAFLERVGGRVLEPSGIPLNIFGSAGSEGGQQATFRRAKSFIDVISKIYKGVGPVQQDRLLNIIIELSAGANEPTLATVLERYKEEAGSADSVVSVLNNFVLGQVFSFDQSELVPFDDLIDDTVLVVNLADFGADQQSKNALVAFFLNQYYEYMQRLRKWPYEGTDPQLRRLNSYLLVDEANNIMQYKFDVLSQLLLQGREFGVGVVLASQYLSHFNVSGMNYGEPLRTWFIHKVPQVTANELHRLGLPDASTADAERISTLEVHEAYYSSLGYAGRFIRGEPFYELPE